MGRPRRLRLETSVYFFEVFLLAKGDNGDDGMKQAVFEAADAKDLSPDVAARLRAAGLLPPANAVSSPSAVAVPNTSGTTTPEDASVAGAPSLIAKAITGSASTAFSAVEPRPRVTEGDGDAVPFASAMGESGSMFDVVSGIAAARTASPPESPAADAAVQATTKSPHAGHRERLRARLMRGGAPSMADYELLELVLFRAIARGDTKPLAKRLVERFGSFGDVINAPEARLAEVHGAGPAVAAELRLVQAAAHRLMHQSLQNKPVLSSWQDVVNYCRGRMAYDDVESLNVLFLDKRNHLLGDERLQTGTVDHTPVYIREVLKRALEVGATALILVHNHPSGDPTPSRSDIEMTNRIIAAAKPFDIVIHDHIIVGRDGHSSFRNLGLIR